MCTEKYPRGDAGITGSGAPKGTGTGMSYGANTRWMLNVFFSDKLGDIAKYIKTIEGALSTTFDKCEDDIDRQTAKMSPQERDQCVEMATDDAFQLADCFPSMVRNTSFVSLYALFEYRLLRLCDHVKKCGRFPEGPKDGRNKGVTAAKVYLKKVAKVHFPDQSREWNEINHMADIRNLLSHRQGQLKGEPSEAALLAYIMEKKSLIELNGMAEIALNAGYCEHAIDVIGRFYEVVVEAIPDDLLSQSPEEEMADIQRRWGGDSGNE